MKFPFGISFKLDGNLRYVKFGKEKNNSSAIDVIESGIINDAYYNKKNANGEEVKENDVNVRFLV